MRPERSDGLKTQAKTILAGVWLCFGLSVIPAHQREAGGISITEQGVGPLNTTTPFDIARIAVLFPRLSVVAGVASTEGVEFPTIRIMDGQTQLFLVAPGEDRKTIGSIVVTNERILHDGRQKIGLAYSELYGAAISNQCFPGKEEDSGKIICRASSSSRVRFVFSGVSDRPDGSLPSINALRTMRVIEMFWKP
jgi:hypothetical protein